MTAASKSQSHSHVSRFVGLALPREHGSWSLALEPVALGLIAAPSAAGGWLALAVTAGFLARRPLRLAFRDSDARRRASAWSVAAVFIALALGGFGAALLKAGSGWLGWLIPSVIGGVIFMWFDLRNEGRSAVAEVAGAVAFSALPAAFAILSGWSPPHASALAILMIGRAVPTVLGVRAYLRATKTGVWRAEPALIAAGLALTGGIVLMISDLAPTVGPVLLGLLALRTAALLVFPRPILRARTLGMVEAATGVGFVLIAGLAAR
jgi:hypothetical protein